MPGLVQRAVVNKGDRVLSILLFQRKQIPHGFDENKNTSISAVVPFLTHLSENANHIETDPIQQQRGSHRRTTRSRSEPTPQAIPNIVRNERILCAHSVARD